MNSSNTFETAVFRLEQIVNQLEQGDLPLEDALKLFQEGTGLVKTCTKLLDDAELKVVQVMKGPDGLPTETEFEHDAD